MHTDVDQSHASLHVDLRPNCDASRRDSQLRPAPKQIHIRFKPAPDQPAHYDLRLAPTGNVRFKPAPRIYFRHQPSSWSGIRLAPDWVTFWGKPTMMRF